MNLKQLTKQLGSKLRLRPLPFRIGSNGEQLPQSDDQWRLDTILDQPPRVRLVNIQTGHFVELQPDNVREYRSPEFLLLRCQLTITPREVSLEPILNYNETYTRLETQMPALLAEMRQDLSKYPLRREIVVLKRSWSYWGKGNELAYYLNDHPDLLSQLQILANQGLVTDITYNNVTRYLLSEELARYLGA